VAEDDALRGANVGMAARPPAVSIVTTVVPSLRYRGRHLTNFLPLLRGWSYIEFRHLGSREFFRSPGRVERLASVAIKLLSDLSARRIARRVLAVVDCVGRLRTLGGERLTRTVQELGRAKAEASDRHYPGLDDAKRRLLIETLRLVKSDPRLFVSFPGQRHSPIGTSTASGARTTNGLGTPSIASIAGKSWTSWQGSTWGA
jgi:hypothetical protein